MQQEYIDDREWLHALRKAAKDKEDLQERQKLKGNYFGKIAQKRKAPEQATAMAKKPKHTVKEKSVYQAAKKEAAKAEKGIAAPRKKIIHRVWKTAHDGIDQKEIDQRKAKGQCRWCTLNNHGWKYCEKEIRISAARLTSNPPRRPGRQYNIPVGKKKPRVAAVAEDSLVRKLIPDEPKATSVDLSGRQWAMMPLGTTGGGKWVVRLSKPRFEMV